MCVALRAPASTLATVCLPRLGLPGLALLVDGVNTTGFAQRDYVCVAGVGSGAQARVISRGGVDAATPCHEADDGDSAAISNRNRA